MPGDVAGHQGGALLLGFEGGDLLVQGADAGPLLVVQHGQVDGPGQVVFGKLGGGTGVDDLVVLAQFVAGDHTLLATRDRGFSAFHGVMPLPRPICVHGRHLGRL
jgi:hypothetical protein